MNSRTKRDRAEAKSACLLVVTIFCLLAVCRGCSLGAAEFRDQVTDRNMITWALVDLLAIPEADRPFQRYLSAPPASTADWIHVQHHVVNSVVSQSLFEQSGQIVANGYLVRWDLRDLAPEGDQLVRLMELWDSLAKRDPYYHVSQVTAEAGLVKVAKNAGATIAAPHIGLVVSQMQTTANYSPSLAYRFDMFQDQVFRANRSSLGQGMYYDFLQLPKPQEGQSDLDAILDAWGIDYAKVVELVGERRVACFTSDITGRVRRVDTYVGNGGLRVWVTQDVRESSVDAFRHPIYSLLRFSPDAKEIILERPNGRHAYLLTNAKGELQDAVPDDIARDRSPHPFPARLTPGHSCLSCHGASDGLIPVRNDVQVLLSSGLSTFGDLKGYGDRNVLDVLQRMYGGRQFDRLLETARLYHEDTVRQGIASMQAAEIPADVSAVGLVAKESDRIWNAYRHRHIDAYVAWGELTGQWLEDTQQANELLTAALRPRKLPAVEDPALAHLLAGGRITRQDWERVYVVAALTYYQNQQEPEK